MKFQRNFNRKAASLPLSDRLRNVFPAKIRKLLRQKPLFYASKENRLCAFLDKGMPRKVANIAFDSFRGFE
jgi:hypothetical protein